MLDGVEGQGPRSGKFSRTHVLLPRRPRRSPLFFLESLFIYTSSFFFGPRIFFLPLGRPSAATEGAAKMHDLRGGVSPEEEGCAHGETADERR